MTLEELLNKLIEKGWKPFGWEVRKAKKGSYNNLYYGFDSHPELYYIRELVSKESGLWQFCCENGMVRNTDLAYCKHLDKYADNEQWYYTRDYQYRVLESSLKDESELEEFLLQSINVEG